MKWLLVLLFVPIWVFAAVDVKESVVKIYTTSKEYDYSVPWAPPSVVRSSGSGFIIEGNQILTNAHVVSDATFIEIHTGRSKRRYEARVKMIGHDCDLALLVVDDPKFFVGKTPLEISDQVLLQEKEVQAYGYPIGGDEICVTRGIVSRIDLWRYVHSGEWLLISQMDAAINPGNSGGPIIAEGKVVGVAHQGISDAQNIGYMIPIPIIRHFLDENPEDYKGFPSAQFYFQEFRNKGLRKYHGIEMGDEGILMTKIPKNHFFDGVLKKGDILLEVDGKLIDSTGMIHLEDVDLTLPFQYLLLLKHYGDSYEVTFLREGEKMTASGIVDREKRAQRLVPHGVYEEKPRYFVFGGCVFQPLEGNLIADSFPAVEYLCYLRDGEIEEDRDEVVVLTSVFDEGVNSGYSRLRRKIIEKVNGNKVPNLREFVQMIEEAEGPFILIETEDHKELVFDKEEAKRKNHSILKRYFIPHDRSEDLR